MLTITRANRVFPEKNNGLIVAYVDVFRNLQKALAIYAVGSKAGEVPEAIRKGVEVAKRSMITVPMVGTTIPHEVRFKWGAAKILLKPAAPGTGAISGGAMRAVIELSGIKDILTKSLGTNNPINTVRATMAALQTLRTAQEVADLRGKTVEEIVGRRLSQVYRNAAAEGKIETPDDAAPEPEAAGEPAPGAAT